MWRLVVFLSALLAPLAQAQIGPYDDSFLAGAYAAHDLFGLLDGSGRTARGLRQYDGEGTLISLVEFATRTPLSYDISEDGRVRWRGAGFNAGVSGSVALAGNLSVYAPHLRSGEDSEVPGGYAALRVSVALGTGYRATHFSGDYSYHALVFNDEDFWTLFGGAESNGSSRVRIFREGSAPLSFNYRVEDSGATEIGPRNTSFATLAADGDLLIQTVDVADDADPLYEEGYEGVAIFARRAPDNAPMTLADFSGTYQIHEIRVRPNGVNRTLNGTVTAGGRGVFFGTLGGTALRDRINLFDSGVFRLASNSSHVGTLTAGGDFAVVIPENAEVSGGRGEAWMQIWVRTAGGGPLPGDRDGDGVRDSAEAARGTSQTNRDSDGDGLLDNTDPRPSIADNVVQARLSPAAVTLEEGAEAPEVTLSLDTNDYPFFEWQLSDNASWLSLSPISGEGDRTVEVRIDARTFTLEGSPYTASIGVSAPGMQDVAPIPLEVVVQRSDIRIDFTPSALAFTGVEGGIAPRPQTLAFSSPDRNDFIWQFETPPTWLNVSPREGTGPATVNVAVNPAGLDADDSPFAAELVLRTSGEGATEASLPVTLTLLPPRALQSPFPVAAGGGDQRHPAVAHDIDTGRYCIVWEEAGQIWLAVLDQTGTPLLAPTLISGTDASQPAVVVANATGQAFVVWTQRVPQLSETILQYRTLNLATLALRPFPTGVPTHPGNASDAALAYDDLNGQLLLAYRHRVNADISIRLARLTESTAASLADFPLAASIAPAETRNPRLAMAPDTGEISVTWIEGTDVGAGLQPMRTLFQRVLGDRPAGTPLVLESANTLRAPVQMPGGAGEAAMLYVAEARARFLRLEEGAATFEQVLSSPTIVPHMALAYGDMANQYRAVWTDNGIPQRLRWQPLTRSGALLGPEHIIEETGTPLEPELVYNTLLNEHLLVWTRATGSNGQIWAVRLPGGSDDEDADGLPNDWEITHGLDPLDAADDNGAAGDPDGDGLSNADELRMNTNPRDEDSDNDGLLDPQEDRNRDGRLGRDESDPNLADTDGDGANDDVEWFNGTGANNPTAVPREGLYRVDYGHFRAGQATAVTLYSWSRLGGMHTLGLGEAGGWTAPSGWLTELEGERTRTLPSGTSYWTVHVTPTQASSGMNDFAVLAFTLTWPGGNSARSVEALVDEAALEAPAGMTSDEVARRHAPVLRLHRDEFYRPMPVESFVGSGRIEIDNTPITPASADLLDLAQSPWLESRLNIEGNNATNVRAGYPDQHPARVYYTLSRLVANNNPGAPASHFALQYYLLFHADEGAAGGSHEGDWETIQLLLDELGEPYAVTLSQSAAPQAAETYPWSRIRRAFGTHPIVFVAGGEHSLHIAPGVRRIAGVEEFDGLGTWATPPLLLTDYPRLSPYELDALPRLHEVPARHWLRYAGWWGRPLPNASAGIFGSRGPVFWESAGTRPWAQPAVWADSVPSPEPPAPATIRGTAPESYAGWTIALLSAEGGIYRSVIDDDTRDFLLEVPPGMYLAQILEPGPLFSEQFRARILLETQAGRTPFLPTLPLGDPTDLGMLEEVEPGILLGGPVFEELDTDGDTIPDFADPDIDGDGLANLADPDAGGDGFDDAYQAQDADLDGLTRYYDADDDNDGIPDTEDEDADGNNVPDLEDPADYDGDGFIDAVDVDMDNDGASNEEEIAAGTHPRNYYDAPHRPAGDLDADGDRDIADAQRLVNMAIRRAAYDPRADFDANGRIDAVDIQSIIAVILGLR